MERSLFKFQQPIKRNKSMTIRTEKTHFNIEQSEWWIAGICCYFGINIGFYRKTYTNEAFKQTLKIIGV